MIKAEKNADLLPFNTFGLKVKAKLMCRIASLQALEEVIESEIFRSEPYYILGGGSNILFTQDYNGLILKVDLKGHSIVEENSDYVLIKVQAGVNWHAFVQYAVENNYGGIENLSLIPGTMGAAPIQNIGAYGVEIKNVVQQVDAIDLSSGHSIVFNNEKCEFGYRESVFKRGGIKKYFISSVTLRLTKKNHQLSTHYGALHDAIKHIHINELSLQNISDAVIKIRQSKLPDPAVIGNAGSFFKNPTLSVAMYEELKKEHPQMPSYPVDNEHVKVPAGWLIESCGWKGKKINKVGVHPLQALVLVNYGNGTGEEILQLSEKIQASVLEKFEITLTPEVNIL